MIKLHLGSGQRNFGPDWTHIDGGEYPHLQGHDVTKLPFSDESVDLIYSSHLIAYFDRLEIVPILQEWRRVLKVGGVLRLATPDFLKMACLYCDGHVHLSDILGPIYGRMKMGDQWIYHKTTYDINSLTTLLKEAGFSSVKNWDWKQVEHGHIDDCSHAHLPHDPNAIATMNYNRHTLISLNLEGIK